VGNFHQQFPKKLCRSFVGLIVVFFLVITCLRPLAAGAETLPRQPEPENKITVLNIALFYTGLMGIFIGAATGWVTLVLTPSGSEKNALPVPQEKKK